MSEHAATITRPPQTQAAEYHRPTDSQINVGGFERVLSVLGGGALAIYGLRRSLSRRVRRPQSRTSPPRQPLACRTP